MKKTILLSSLFAISFTALAIPRSEEAAREIAYFHFCKNSAGKHKAKSKNELTLAGTASHILGDSSHGKSRVKGVETEPFYVYNNGAEGFVIVSGDDAVDDILAYSDAGAFEFAGMPAQLRGWLQTYADEIAYVRQQSSSSNRSSQLRVNKASAYPASVDPLLKANGEMIQWDQNAPFNGECPNYLGYVCPVGCVATAFGQIMYYHRWPEKGQGGTKTYISEPNSLSQSFTYSGTTFDYDKMLPRYSYGKYTEEQGKEVAKFCHGIGVAVDMMYDPSGSGAYSLYCGDAILKYFNYDQNLHYAYRDYFSQDEWIDMIKKELSEGRPICYAGSSTSIGHQFVFDGYDSCNRVHVNWGWAGMSDGYFTLSVLSPSNTGTGGGSVTSGGFIYNQAMWLGLQPPTAQTSPVSHLVLNTYSAYTGTYTTSFLSVDKMNAMVGESLTLSTKEITNLSTAFSGVLGVVLEDANGNQLVLNQTKAKSMRCAMINRDEDAVNQQFILPSDLTDGSYTLYMASKADGEEKWSRIRAAEGYCDGYDVLIQNGMATLSYNGEPDADGTLVVDHAIYTKCRSQFTAKVRNNNKREFFGVAHVGVFTEDANGTINLIGLCGREQVTLPAGKDIEIVFRGAIEAAKAGTTISQGDYKACVVVENQGKYYQVSEIIDVTVKRIPSGMASLTSNDFSLSKDSYGIDEPIQGHVKVTNSRSVYSDFLGIIIFKEKSNQGKPYWEKEVFLEKDIAAEYDFLIPAQFEPGIYKASLRYTGGAEYSNEVANCTFEVRGDYVGLQDVAVQEGKVLSTEYFNLSGQKLAGKPSRGTYLVRKRTDKGVVVNKVAQQ